MLRKRRQIRPVADRGPLRVMWMGHSLPAGNAERRLRDVIRQLDGERFLPEVCCLRSPGGIGEELARDIPVHGTLRLGRFDLLLLPRLMRLFRRRRVDAVVAFGGEDALFWGRLAAWLADVPVVLAARAVMGTTETNGTADSAGAANVVGRWNRLLTRVTDGLVAVSETGSLKRTVAIFQDAITAVYERKAAARRGCYSRPRRDTIAVE